METITMFSQNDCNNINQVLSDENFDRKEIYDVINALDRYEILLDTWGNSKDRIEQIRKTREKFERIAQIDLENE